MPEQVRLPLNFYLFLFRADLEEEGTLKKVHQRNQPRRTHRLCRFFTILAFLFPLTAFGTSSPPESCPWVNIYNNDMEEIITPKRIYSRMNEAIQYESCERAIARRKFQVERSKANQNAGQTITGGTQRNCPWEAPLPPHTRFSLTLNQTGTKPNGEPQYESCGSAQRRKQKEWIDNDFDGHREDAEAAIQAFNDGLDQQALSANEKAKKAAEKQKKTSLITTAGAMAAGVAAAACCSSTSCRPKCPYLVALSAGLGFMGMVMGMASTDNEQIASDYRGLMDTPGGQGTPDGDNTDGSPDPDIGMGGGSTFQGGNIPNPEFTLPDWEDVPTVKIPGGGPAIPTPANLGPFLKKHGLTWSPKDKTMTLPNGKSFTADDLDKPEFRQYASSPEASRLQAQMKGLEKQITQATGGDDLAEGEGSEDDSLGGGGFSGYSGENGAGYGGGTLVAGMGGGGSPGSSASDGSKVAGMSVKMGKNRVGVSQDNIFEMIHRRYQAKRKKQHFIEF